ncbi:hypothetical protein SCHPADRAFT_710385 [Schizopora paradoxa]|uniref:Uncharacterized protein n=1 Tax=Schizopora paradoxa TaxID=27342 RepID=A0A0H2R246_9AGAM|nr:hypothetical protein SCHPADRAFT_710385 [Schizopora paradoxa]
MEVAGNREGRCRWGSTLPCSQRGPHSSKLSVQHPDHPICTEHSVTRAFPSPRLPLRHLHNDSSPTTAISSTWVPESSSTHQRGGRSLSLVRYQILSNHIGTGCSQRAASASAIHRESRDEAPSLHRAVAVEKEEELPKKSVMEGSQECAARLGLDPFE